MPHIRDSPDPQPKTAIGVFDGRGVASETASTIECLAVEAEQVVGCLGDLAIRFRVNGSQMTAGQIEEALDGIVAGSCCTQEECLGTVGVKGVTVLLGDDVERLVPADALELA